MNHRRRFLNAAACLFSALLPIAAIAQTSANKAPRYLMNCLRKFKRFSRESTGRERTFKKTDIVQRKELKTSLMPTGIVAQLTDDDLRDLLAFLSAKDDQ